MEHTQGEWYVSEHEDNQDVVIRTKENKFQIVANCEVDFVRYDKATYEILANAHLIAAAPDLLAACKMMLQLMEAENLDEEFDGEAEVLRDVITKAAQ